jgi:MFS family permease
MLGLTRYQWLVLFAAWLGWGFDVFDGLLFNYVAPICIPNLLGFAPGDPAAKPLKAIWTASLTSLLLVGWALGGILFGKITDRLGRTRALLFTMLTYALATAACAFAPNIYVLAVFRFIAALGIGGEWAAGASLVAETMPKDKRVLGGALLYTSAPAGLFLATYVNDLFTRRLDVIASDPNISWRAVFLTGIVPAIVAILIRLKVREPEHWKPEAEPRIGELFAPELKRYTLSGLAMALVALITWWSCSAFIPLIADHLADEGPVLDSATRALRVAENIKLGTNVFNLGGLIGTLLTIPAALVLGRRPMYFIYFGLSAASLWLTFLPDWSPTTRLYLLFTVGLSVFGVFGSFTFYLPELFPMRVRGTGSGFTYNVGRIVTAVFPFMIGQVVANSKSGGPSLLNVMAVVGIIPAMGALAALSRVVVETRDTNAISENR